MDGGGLSAGPAGPGAGNGPDAPGTGPDGAPADGHCVVIDGPGCDDAVDLDGGNVVLARRPARPDEYEPEYGPRDDPEVRA